HPLLERRDLRERAGGIAGTDRARFEILRATVLVPEAMTAGTTREPGEVGLRRDTDLLEEPQRAIDDLGEGPERATGLAATFEHHAALEANATAELREQTRLADPAPAFDEDETI